MKKNSSYNACPRHLMSMGGSSMSKYKFKDEVGRCQSKRQASVKTYWYDPFGSGQRCRRSCNLVGSDDEFKHRLGNNEWLEIKKDSVCACATVHLVNIALLPANCCRFTSQSCSNCS